VDPADARILLTEPPQNPLANRERLLETMFERYGFAGAPGCRARAALSGAPEPRLLRVARRRLCSDPGSADALRTRCAPQPIMLIPRRGPTRHALLHDLDHVVWWEAPARDP
jgi:hypothetical protein